MITLSCWLLMFNNTEQFWATFAVCNVDDFQLQLNGFLIWIIGHDWLKNHRRVINLGIDFTTANMLQWHLVSGHILTVHIVYADDGVKALTALNYADSICNVKGPPWQHKKDSKHKYDDAHDDNSDKDWTSTAKTNGNGCYYCKMSVHVSVCSCVCTSHAHIVLKQITIFLNCYHCLEGKQHHSGMGVQCQWGMKKKVTVWPISWFMCEMMQDRAIVAMEREYVTIPKLPVVPFAMILSDL